MSTYKIKKLSILVCLALLPFTAHAAGLGKINVTSSLGEPFSAEIDLLSTTPEELESLVAIVASEEAYAAQGITRLGIHNNIKVEVVDAVNGGKKVKLTSTQAVTDPYVDMLIQLDWASGRLQREYTVLLDPPDYKQTVKNQDVATNAKPEVKLLPPSVQKPVVPQKSTDLSDMPLEGVDAPDASEAAASSTKPEDDVEAKIEQQQDKSQSVTFSKPAPTQRKTKSGDNLSKIASSMRVEGVSLDQMLVALYEQNKSAFVGDNMNRLKVGKVIKLPSKEVLLATRKSDASKTVQAHVENWNDYRANLAGLASETKNAQPEQNNQSESGKIEATTPQATPSQTGGQDVVKLSAGDKDKLSKDSKKAEEAKKIAEQEDKVARDKALAEAQERTVAVEKQIEDMQKLLEMKNKAMSEIQKKAEVENAQKPAEEVKQPQADSQASAENSPQQPSTQESVKQEPTQAEEVKPALTDKPKSDVAVKPQEPIAEEPSFIDTLLQSINLPLLAGIAGIGLLASGWVYLRNKRRKDLESFERGILTSGGLRANTVFGNTTGNTSTSDTSFLTDFAQSTDGSMMDTNDVDPIAEAEVYMAYGRDAQAEEILKDAIVKEPKRYELHLKLLEMYAARKDTSAFEAIAGELYTTLGSDDPTWNKVAEMGKVLEPENPLYAAGATAKVDDIPVATEKVTPKPKDSEPEARKNLNDVVAALNVADATPTENVNSGSRIESIVKHERKESAPKIDLMDDIQVDNTIAVAEELKLENHNVKLTFDNSDQEDRIKQGFESANIEDISFDSDLEASGINQYEVEQSEMTVADLNFDLTQNADDTIAQSVSKASPQDANLKSFDLSTISLDLDGPVTELKLDSQSPEIKPALSKAMTVDASEVEVKLNLVAAYIDMDDKEGARELLDEIMKEGTEEQIMRAQLMLDSIS